jgi:hypothetical protein
LFLCFPFAWDVLLINYLDSFFFFGLPELRTLPSVVLGTRNSNHQLARNSQAFFFVLKGVAFLSLEILEVDWVSFITRILLTCLVDHREGLAFVMEHDPHLAAGTRYASSLWRGSHHTWRLGISFGIWQLTEDAPAA